MMGHSIDVEKFITLAANATAVEFSFSEADEEEPRLDDRDGCWQVFLRSDKKVHWIGQTVEETDAVAFAEKVGRFLKIDVRKA